MPFSRETVLTTGRASTLPCRFDNRQSQYAALSVFHRKQRNNPLADLKIRGRLYAVFVDNLSAQQIIVGAAKAGNISAGRQDCCQFFEMRGIGCHDCGLDVQRHIQINTAGGADHIHLLGVFDNLSITHNIWDGHCVRPQMDDQAVLVIVFLDCGRRSLFKITAQCVDDSIIGEQAICIQSIVAIHISDLEIPYCAGGFQPGKFHPGAAAQNSNLFHLATLHSPPKAADIIHRYRALKIHHVDFSQLLSS